ncbi:hypothetical protein QBC40DRAFT_227401 [Triangularia verruculosa]|uniref:Glycosyltransferase 2 n=1 Tax=Triangularia verruculosa TaxID=2587418 RepID=A0AAN7AW54_9PEZI|nr:hypothetical protein QBC40DRAFT_227401 [Triangularia verruculosa]
MGLFTNNDDAMVKKDDDLKRGKALPTRAPWAPSSTPRTPPRKTIKRLAIVLVVGFFVYLFIRNLPPMDGQVRRDYRHPRYGDRKPPGKQPGPMPKMKPPPPERPPEKPVIKDIPSEKSPAVTSPSTVAAAVSARAYDGPIYFRKLAATLQAIESSTSGYSAVNKNVLFAAASLKSASVLLPMACKMGTELRNYVHFALMGGSEIDLEELRAVNGIDESCQIIFHDARPDYAATSTISRLETCASRGLYHIYKYMHPQVLFLDASGAEEHYFLDGIRKQADASGVPVIDLAKNAYSRLSWMTKLDASSLAAWNRVSIDILIHAPPGGSGSLIRLLRSLSAADFSAGPTPHLTIELPNDIDRATTEFLRDFSWPPVRAHSPSNVRQLTLRHRIYRTRLTEEESSVRLLESFWPAVPRYSHVLVLSPNVQLSPGFYHYLKFTLLEYLYSTASLLQSWDSRLLGISLDLPTTTLLDNSKSFAPPAAKPLKQAKDAKKPSLASQTPSSTPFLWQAPNSNAMLYLGTKWTELHSLVSNTIEHQHSTQSPSTFFTAKTVSKRYPSWLEHAMRLARAKGYFALYPSEATARYLATTHNELFKAPEEYEKELRQDDGAGEEIRLTSGPLLETVKLLGFDEMPIVNWEGKETGLERLDGGAGEFVREFRKAIGGRCETWEGPDVGERLKIEDLFCLRGE